MVKVIDFSDYHKVVVAGDIHGEFEPMMWDLRYRQKVKDAVVIINGDIGMGFYRKNYYISKLKEIDFRCKENNIQLCLFRGNHDNPEYFDDYMSFPELMEYDNIHLIPDYTVLHLVDDFYTDLNILCIGGARSVDKTRRTEGQSWWPGEMVQEPGDWFYDFISGKNNPRINYVCSHTAPLEALPFDTPVDQGPVVEEYSPLDPTLKQECYHDREILSGVLRSLMENGHDVRCWLYGHFHQRLEKYIPWEDKVVNFIGLDMFRRGLGDWIDSEELANDKYSKLSFSD